jgi:integrase
MPAEQPVRLRHPKHADLHIFTRETGGWYAGFHKDGKYHRKATKTDHLPTALRLAGDWYLDCKAAIRIGQFSPQARHTVGDAAKLALAKFQARVERGERSDSYLKGIELLLEMALLPFFGAMDVTKVGPAKWAEYEAHLRATKPKLTRQTLHQHRNALRVCLNEAIRQEWIERLPNLKIEAIGKREGQPRVWFEPPEMRRLLKAARGHIKTLRQTRWAADSEECYDFIIWMANTGMRVGEARNVRFCDIEIETETATDGISRYCCLIKNIRGKRGTGECKSWFAAYNAYKRIVARRGIVDPSKSKEMLFLAHHRDMFNVILDKAGLKFTDTEPRRKRDFVSLRHTYIASRLLHGVPVYDVARNCRTSVAMIENHYTRYLSPRLMTGLNRFERSAASQTISAVPVQV